MSRPAYYGCVPKFPVVDANLTADKRKAFELEHHLADIIGPLRAHDVDTATRALAVAVEKYGDEFIEYCKKQPPNVRAMLANVAKFVDA